MADPIENFNFVEGLNLDDTQFTEQQILDAQSLIRQYLEDRYGDLDSSSIAGLNDVNVRPVAQIYLVVRQMIEQFSNTRTLQDVLDNPEASSDAIVDGLLSNFLLSRRRGSTSVGKIKVNVDRIDVNYTVQTSLIFSTNDGLQFSPQANYVAVQSPTSTSQLRLYPTGISGQGYFIVPVIAADRGAAYNISQYAPLSVAPTLPNLITCTAFNNFSGGLDDESNESVVSRILPAMSARNLATPIAIDQTLRDKFPSITQVSVHGVGSKMMTRNAHNIFGIKSGCYCDVYVKTTPYPDEYPVSLVAEKILSSDEEYGTLYAGKYLARISRDLVPGHYDINAVTPDQDGVLGSYVVLLKKRKFNNLVDGITAGNYLVSSQEATYSRYGYTDVIFDSGVDVSVAPSTLEARIFVEAAGQIKEIQEFVNSPGEQTVLVDTLVRAFVPCFVSLSEIKVHAKTGQTDASTIQKAIIQYIVGLDPAAKKVRVDDIVQTIRAIDGVESVDLPIQVTGQILCPDDNYTSLSFTSESTLEIPERVDLGVSRSTVAFYCRTESIAINLIET